MFFAACAVQADPPLLQLYFRTLFICVLSPLPGLSSYRGDRGFWGDSGPDPGLHFPCDFGPKRSWVAENRRSPLRGVDDVHFQLAAQAGGAAWHPYFQGRRTYEDIGGVRGRAIRP